MDTNQHEQQIRKVREYVAAQIDGQDWGPFDVLTWAADRDLVSEFYAVICFARLCHDKTEPHHRLAHRTTGARNCVGLEFIDQMAAKFGFSDERTKHLIDQFDQTERAFAAMSGSGE